MQGSCPCIYIYIQKDGICSRREMVVWESLVLQGRRREPGRQPPGVLHISRDPWGRLEGALGISQDNHRKVPVRFSVDNGIQNRAETVRLPPGSPTGLLRPSTGCLRPACSRTVSWKRRENWEQLAQHTGARTTSKKIPRGPWESSGTKREPHGNGP